MIGLDIVSSRAGFRPLSVGVAVAASLLVASSAVSAQLTPAEREAVDAVFSEYAASDRPGVSLSVVRGGELVYSRGYGLANLEYGIENSPTTVFHVASVSKQFTCFAILLLADEGRLTIDDDVREHLPWFPDLGETITLRHLMYHTSGVRDQWQLLAMAGFRLDDVITMEHVRKILSRQRDLNFAPGETYLYSNSGYTLLAEVVAAVSGVSFKRFTRERIFEPLGMTRTHFHDDHRHIVQNRAYSYGPTRDGFEKAVLSYANVGATSLFTTAEDLSRWLLNLDSGRVGGERVRDRMLERGSLKSGELISYGFGLTHDTQRSTRRIGHAGADAGFRSYVGRLPEKGFGVVVLGNRADLNPSVLGERVLDVLLGVERETDQGTREAVPEPPGPAEETPERIAVGPAILDAYVGHFLLTTGRTLRVFRRGERLLYQTERRRPREMVPVSEREFLGAESRLRFTMDEIVRGVSPGFTVGVPGRPATRGERVDLESWLSGHERRGGRYYSPELDTSYTLVWRGDHFIVRHPRHTDIVVSPTSPDRCLGDVWFFRELRFELDEEGRATGFRIGGGRVRNLRFVRQSRLRRF